MNSFDSSELTNPPTVNQNKGTYTNPIIFADYSDPDVIRVGDDFYMVSSSFHCMPGIPVLHSKDLVNWEIIGHVYDKLPFERFDKPQHGCGSWAPALRYHNGKFRVFFCTPDEGLFMADTKDPAGPWSELVHIKKTEKWEDPCPFWDDDGQAYLVRSQWGGGPLFLHKMNPDGTELLDDGTKIFEDKESQPTLEGPKFLKKDGYYYIFAPAGGVKKGWQSVLRSENIYGPYEAKIVLAQGKTNINGPHQGGIVELRNGQWWFVHFQDCGAYGRIVHLQPVKWIDDWPIIGEDKDGDGIGEPVIKWNKPDVGRDYPVVEPQSSDNFDTDKLSLQWQWQANPNKQWYSLSAKKNSLRLYCRSTEKGGNNLWDIPNLLLQKFPCVEFTITTKLIFEPILNNEQAGLVIMGKNYSYIAIRKRKEHFRVGQYLCSNADKGGRENEVEGLDFNDKSVYLRVETGEGGICRFSYSTDGEVFNPIGKSFTARPGRWVGAKVGIFCLNPGPQNNTGYADFDWFRITSEP